MDLHKLALGDHPKCEREIEGDADVPTDQNPGHPAKLLCVKRQHCHDGETDDDREQEPRPREENAERHRPFSLRHAGLVMTPRVPIRPIAQARREAMTRARCLSVTAHSPKGARAASASSTSVSRRARVASTPSNATSVALPRSASLAAALPIAAASPSASRRSSTSWKAWPKAEA